MAKGDKNVGWPGFFRIFAVLCAIMLLLARSGQDMAAPGSGAFQVLSVYEGLTAWSIPALFMIWGMFALEEGKPNFSSAMMGLVLPTFGVLVFWGALYAILALLLGGGSLSWGALWSALVSAAKGNTYFHLWLLYPLIGLYLVHPMVHRFTASASRSEARYFLALCFLFGSVLPLWKFMQPDGVIVGLLSRLNVQMVLGWVGFYVAGWYLRHYVIGRVPEFIIYALGILGMVLTLAGSSIFGGGRALWVNYNAPNVVMTAVAFCTLFRYVLGVSDERSRRSAVSRLGGYAFGIYLAHQIWVLVFRWMDISFMSFSPVISVPFFAIVLFLLSIPVAWLLHLIPGVGDYLT